MKLDNNKKKIIIFVFIIIVIVIVGILCGVVHRISRKNREVTYITDNEYLYDVAIEYLKTKYIQEGHDRNKEDYQIFFDYKGFGISQKDNKKYAYMWVLEEGYYVENGKIQSSEGSSMPYKITFEDNNVVDYEIPKDGSYYASSIRDMFPDDIENKILNYNIDDTNLKNKVKEHYSYLDLADYNYSITKYEFIGEIIESYDSYIIVKPEQGSKELKSSDKIQIGINRPINGTNDFYVVGNKIKITYNGEIMESYPAQIKAISIVLAD